MGQRLLSWSFDHATVAFPIVIVAGLLVLVAIRRPRRWVQWLADAGAVIAIVIAVGALYFFTNVASSLERRTQTMTFTDLNDRQVRRLRDYRGSVVLVNYWATWCMPCRKELPDLSRLADAYRGRQVVVLTVSDERPEVLSRFRARYPLTTEVAQFVSDPPRGTVDQIAFQGRPSTLIFDRDGRLRQEFIGDRTYPDFDAAIRAAL